MGVHGLWEALSPSGVRIDPKYLSSKIMAIDSSIWLIQFLKSLRSEEGEMLKNAYIYGFFTRICKLLYYRIKPVFVFDGKPPELKRKTLKSRRELREKNEFNAKKIAEKILINALRKNVVKQAKMLTCEETKKKIIEEKKEEKKKEEQKGKEENKNDIIMMLAEGYEKEKEKEEKEKEKKEEKEEKKEGKKEEKEKFLLEKEKENEEDNLNAREENLFDSDDGSSVSCEMHMSALHARRREEEEEDEEGGEASESRVGRRHYYDDIPQQFRGFLSERRRLDDIQISDEDLLRMPSFSLNSKKNLNSIIGKFNNNLHSKKIFNTLEDFKEYRVTGAGEEEIFIELPLDAQIDAQVFRTLPLKLQYHILMQLRDAWVNDCRVKALQAKSNLNVFSNVQIESYLRTVRTNAEINKIKVLMAEEHRNQIEESESTKSASSSSSFPSSSSSSFPSSSFLSSSVPSSSFASSSFSSLTGNRLEKEDILNFVSGGERKGRRKKKDSGWNTEGMFYTSEKLKCSELKPHELYTYKHKVNSLNENDGWCNNNNEEGKNKNVYNYNNCEKSKIYEEEENDFFLVDEKGENSFKKHIAYANDEEIFGRDFLNVKNEGEEFSFFSSSFINDLNRGEEREKEEKVEKEKEEDEFDDCEVDEASDVKEETKQEEKEKEEKEKEKKEKEKEKKDKIEEKKTDIAKRLSDSKVRKVISFRKKKNTQDVFSSNTGLPNADLHSSFSSSFSSSFLPASCNIVDSLSPHSSSSLSSFRSFAISSSLSSSASSSSSSSSLPYFPSSFSLSAFSSSISSSSSSSSPSSSSFFPSSSSFFPSSSSSFPSSSSSTYVDKTRKLASDESAENVEDTDRNLFYLKQEIEEKEKRKKKKEEEEKEEKEEKVSVKQKEEEIGLKKKEEKKEKSTNEIIIEEEKIKGEKYSEKVGLYNDYSDIKEQKEKKINKKKKDEEVIDFSPVEEIEEKKEEKKEKNLNVLGDIVMSDDSVEDFLFEEEEEKELREIADILDMQQEKEEKEEKEQKKEQKKEDENGEKIGVEEKEKTQNDYLLFSAEEKEKEEKEKKEGKEGKEEKVEEEENNSSFFEDLNMPGELDEWADKLEEEEILLREKLNKQKRDAHHASSDMYEEIRVLLQAFGIPFVEAPAEAEAQCAALTQLNLCHAVISDDSDTLLFGGVEVFRNFFESKKSVEFYDMQIIKQKLGIEREQMVLLAMLLGCDYTLGVKGVGIVNALEIINCYPTLHDLKTFKRWATSVTNIHSASISEEDSPLQRAFKLAHKNYRFQWKFPADFPSVYVWEAYMRPSVDASAERFTWAPPDPTLIANILTKSCDITYTKVMETLTPVLERLKDDTLGRLQPRIDTIFKYKMCTNEGEEKNAEENIVGFIRSKRMAKAVRFLRNQNESEQGVGEEGEGMDAAKTKKKRKTAEKKNVFEEENRKTKNKNKVTKRNVEIRQPSEEHI